jgi:alginate O-acetyltransferase complex protein AlgI
MSYAVDVYKGAAAQRSAVSFGAYITMFPQLVAGPIVRYGEVERELSDRHTDISDISEGLRIFAVGLGKKVLLANGAGNIRNIFLSSGEGYISLVGRWLALILFAFQIYYDFGGYSDMAVGLGRIFGFHFPKNFDYPYISKSITEFWRRWHMTLSAWFREYVYIPLGGNRCSRGRMYLNLFITWLLTGIWHGAEWCFVAWGLYFFLLLVLEKSFWGRMLVRLPSAIQRAYALLAILFGWFIFTFEGGVSIAELGYLFGIGVDSFADGFALYELLRWWVWIAIMTIGATPIPKRLMEYLKTRLPRLGVAFEALWAPVCIFVCTARLCADSYNPFLYFRF